MLWICIFVEAAVCRQLISARRPSRVSGYAAFLSIHCAYTLVAHTCVLTVIPHMCIQINCTVLNCLPYCLVVYASATFSVFMVQSICCTDSENRTTDGFYIKYMRLLVLCFCTYLPKFKLLQKSNISDVGVNNMVLLQNYGFCNGCITERCLNNSRNVLKNYLVSQIL